MERRHRHAVAGTRFRAMEKREYRRLSRRCGKLVIRQEVVEVAETGFWLPQYPISTALAEMWERLYQRQVEIVHYFWDFGLSKRRLKGERKLLSDLRGLYAGERYSIRTRQALDRRSRADRRCPADQYYF
jgi:hypothetical protein